MILHYSRGDAFGVDNTACIVSAWRVVSNFVYFIDFHNTSCFKSIVGVT